MQILIELLLEFLIQVIAEALLELGLHAMVEPFHKPPSPWLAAIGYANFGLIFGGASLWLFPHNAVSGETWRWINLLLTPIAVGLCMSWMGAWRAKRAQTLFRIDRFSYGYLFALGFALTRFFWAA